MKKIFFSLLLVSVSLIVANQFIAQRSASKDRRGIKELQQECCQLCLDIQQIAVSGYMRLLAELNDLLLTVAADCITGHKEAVLLASSKQEVAAIEQQLVQLKQKMIENNRYIAQFIEQFKRRQDVTQLTSNTQ